MCNFDLLAAIAAKAATGGTVSIPAGVCELPGLLTVPAGVRLVGEGQAATRLTWPSTYTGPCVAVGDRAALVGLTVALPAACADHGVTVTAATHAELTDLYVTGGASPAHYALRIINFFGVALRNVRVSTAANGIQWANTDGVYFYGNAAAQQVSVVLLAQPRIGLDFDSMPSGNNKNVNLLQFADITVISLNTVPGTGSIGVRIRNSNYLAFDMLCVERCETSLDVEGRINGGSLARGHVFTCPYIDANVVLRTGARNLTFVGGQIQGTITQTEIDPRKQSVFLNVLDVTGNRIVMP